LPKRSTFSTTRARFAHPPAWDAVPQSERNPRSPLKAVGRQSFGRICRPGEKMCRPGETCYCAVARNKCSAVTWRTESRSCGRRSAKVPVVGSHEQMAIAGQNQRPPRRPTPGSTTTILRFRKGSTSRPAKSSARIQDIERLHRMADVDDLPSARSPESRLSWPLEMIVESKIRGQIMIGMCAKVNLASLKIFRNSRSIGRSARAR